MAIGIKQVLVDQTLEATEEAITNIIQHYDEPTKHTWGCNWRYDVV